MRHVRRVLLLLVVAGTAACSSPVTVTIERNPAPTSIAQAVDPTAPSTPAGTARPVSSPARPDLQEGSVAAAALRTPGPTVLQIPVIGLDATVESISSSLDGDRWTWLVPVQTAAHHMGTAHPGEPGNIVISGHVSTEGGSGVFVNLSQVQVGDKILLRSSGGEFTYQVVSTTVVPEEDTSVLHQGLYERVTLLTCVSDGVFLDRLVVRAERI